MTYVDSLYPDTFIFYCLFSARGFDNNRYRFYDLKHNLWHHVTIGSTGVRDEHMTPEMMSTEGD